MRTGAALSPKRGKEAGHLQCNFSKLNSLWRGNVFIASLLPKTPFHEQEGKEPDLLEQQKYLGWSQQANFLTSPSHPQAEMEPADDLGLAPQSLPGRHSTARPRLGLLSPTNPETPGVLLLRTAPTCCQTPGSPLHTSREKARQQEADPPQEQPVHLRGTDSWQR